MFQFQFLFLIPSVRIYVNKNDSSEKVFPNYGPVVYVHAHAHAHSHPRSFSSLSPQLSSPSPDWILFPPDIFSQPSLLWADCQIGGAITSRKACRRLLHSLGAVTHSQKHCCTQVPSGIADTSDPALVRRPQCSALQQPAVPSVFHSSKMP